MAIYAIKEFATLTGILDDRKGGYCALGAMAKAANLTNYGDSFQKAYGVTPVQMRMIVLINNFHQDTKFRHERLIRYLMSRPLETEPANLELITAS